MCLEGLNGGTFRRREQGKRRREGRAVRASTVLVSLCCLSIWMWCCIMLILAPSLHRNNGTHTSVLFHVQPCWPGCFSLQEGEPTRPKKRGKKKWGLMLFPSTLDVSIHPAAGDRKADGGAPGELFLVLEVLDLLALLSPHLKNERILWNPSCDINGTLNVKMKILRQIEEVLMVFFHAQRAVLYFNPCIHL